MNDDLTDVVVTDPMDVKENDTLTLFNNSDEFSRALMDFVANASDDEKMEFLQTRRQQMFKPLWETGDMERDFVLSKARNREQDAMEYYQERMDGMGGDVDLPDFILRLQGQDVLAETLLEGLAGTRSAE